MDTLSYEPRYYRLWSIDKDLVSFAVVLKETDLYIRARRNLHNKALAVVKKQRALLENYIKRHPGFVIAMEPFITGDDVPAIVKTMVEASTKVGVGPMASVAGTIAEYTGRELLNYSGEVIVENGGDIFLKTERKRLIGIYVGTTPYTGKIALEITPEQTPIGICTSSGTVGHSTSYGKADAAIVLSKSTALADAAATAIGNMVNSESDVNKAIEAAQAIDGVAGVIIIKDDTMALWGDVKIVQGK